jgi:NitT/TauT family transport system permease protein
MRSRSLTLLAPLLAGLLLVALWHCVHASLPLEKQYLVPSPGQVADAFVESRSILAPSALTTAGGAAAGLLGAIIVGYGLAVVLACSRLIRASLYPWLMVLQMTPVIVFAPILVLVIEESILRVSIITFSICFFPLVVNTAQGLLSVDQQLLDFFRLSRASRLDEFRRLRIPAAQPYFFTGLRIAATLAPIGAIVGDYTAGNAEGGVGGLGFQIVLTSSRFQMPELYATALTGCALGFLFVSVVIGLQWLALHRWHDSYEQNR